VPHGGHQELLLRVLWLWLWLLLLVVPEPLG
jgi:hypothetical protein